MPYVLRITNYGIVMFDDVCDDVRQQGGVIDDMFLRDQPGLVQALLGERGADSHHVHSRGQRRFYPGA